MIGPLLQASPAIQIHTAAAVLAAVSGIAVLIRRKGGLTHRATGYLYVAAMSVAAASSFWITGVVEGRYSWIHILSIVTLISMGLALYFRRKGAIRAHAINMIFPFIGLIIAGAFTLAPGRIMHQVFLSP